MPNDDSLCRSELSRTSTQSTVYGVQPLTCDQYRLRLNFKPIAVQLFLLVQYPVEIRTHNPAQYFLERNLEQCKEIPRFYYFQEIVAYYVVHSALICATN